MWLNIKSFLSQKVIFLKNRNRWEVITAMYFLTVTYENQQNETRKNC